MNKVTTMSCLLLAMYKVYWSHIPLQIQTVIRVAKTNFVMMKLLSGGHKKDTEVTCFIWNYFRDKTFKWWLLFTRNRRSGSYDCNVCTRLSTYVVMCGFKSCVLCFFCELNSSPSAEKSKGSHSEGSFLPTNVLY